MNRRSLRVMKDNPKPWLYGPDWQGKRCGAITRRSTLCKRPGNKTTGRCRLHGGCSTGPRTEDGLAKLAKSKTIHGRFTKSEREKAKHRAEVGRQVKREIKEIEQWAMNHGHLVKNWRDQFK